MKRMRKRKRKKDDNNNKEDDLKVNEIKHEVKSIDGFLAVSGNCRSHILPILYWKKELKLLQRLLKCFGMKGVKAVVAGYPCDGAMAKKRNNTVFNLADVWQLVKKVKESWEWNWCKFQLHLMNQMEVK